MVLNVTNNILCYKLGIFSTPNPLQPTLLRTVFQICDLLILIVLPLLSNKFKNDIAGSLFLGLATMAKHTLTLASYAPYHSWNTI